MPVQSWRLDFSKMRNVPYTASTRYSIEVRASYPEGALVQLKDRYRHATHNHDQMKAALEHDPDGSGFTPYHDSKSYRTGVSRI